MFNAAEAELRARRGGSWSSEPFDPSSMWSQVQRHLLAHDGDRSFVAEAGGRIVGFTSAFVRDDFWFFSALFIDPSCQGQGIGRRLFELAWAGGQLRRATITEAIQPVSTGLYARRGLLPVTPVLAFVGNPAIEANDGLEPRAITEQAVRAIDFAAYGFDRAVDHELWARTSTRATLWLRDGEPCAYSYRGGFHDGRVVGPVAGLDPEAAAQALSAELAANAGEEIYLEVPGSATALVQVAIDAGLRLTDPSLLLLAPPDAPPTSYALHSSWLL